MQVSYRSDTIRVELYKTTRERVRLVLEVILTTWVCVLLVKQVWAAARAWQKQVGALSQTQRVTCVHALLLVVCSSKC